MILHFSFYTLLLILVGKKRNIFVTISTFIKLDIGFINLSIYKILLCMLNMLIIFFTKLYNIT